MATRSLRNSVQQTMRLNPWVLAVATVLLGLLVGPLTAWLGQFLRLVRGCSNGLGNRGATGELTAGYCEVRVDGAAWLRVPWVGELSIALALFLAAAAVVLSVLKPRWRVWLAAMPIPALLVAGLLMGQRAWTERRMERVNSMLVFSPETMSPEGFSVSGHADGWLVHSTARALLIPEPSGHWFVVAFLAGVVAVGYGIVAARPWPDLDAARKPS